MAQQYNYACGRCKKPTPRELLTVKKIEFRGMGVGAKTLRTRVDSWLCPECVVEDPHWNKDPYVAATVAPVSVSHGLTPIDASASIGVDGTERDS
jgi:hypothetical protein